MKFRKSWSQKYLTDIKSQLSAKKQRWYGFNSRVFWTLLWLVVRFTINLSQSNVNFHNFLSFTVITKSIVWILNPLSKFLSPYVSFFYGEGYYFRSGIIFGPIWGSFAVPAIWESFAVWGSFAGVYTSNLKWPFFNADVTMTHSIVGSSTRLEILRVLISVSVCTTETIRKP